MASDAKYWLGFNLVAGIGPVKLRHLLTTYGSIGAAWHAEPASLLRHGIDRRTVENLLTARNSVDLDAELERLRQGKIDICHWGAPNYPELLNEIAQPPPLLYISGKLTPRDKQAIAIVGTRRVTAYGRRVTQELVRALVHQGITIVSGLARGVDAIAHKAAIEQGGRTIAVLGSGLDHIYPPENRQLAYDVAANDCGAIVTEYALGTKPEARNFPPRNRVISGLSRGVIVIEAGERSGALITAMFALEQDREVFAVPGPIHSPASRGPNRLIQNGAKLITTAEDVLNELRFVAKAAPVAVQLALPESEEESRVLRALSAEPQHVDLLSRMCGLPAGNITGLLTMLELKGLAQATGGMCYVAT